MAKQKIKVKSTIAKSVVKKTAFNKKVFDSRPRFFAKIYASSWKRKQHQKYFHLLPILKSLLNAKSVVIDYGIGPGWLWFFLEKNKVKFKKVIGFEPKPEKELIHKKLKIVHSREKLDIEIKKNKKIDLIILFDSFHLLSETELNYLKELKQKQKAMILISLPKSKEHIITNHIFGDYMLKGDCGVEEVDAFWVIK